MRPIKQKMNTPTLINCNQTAFKLAFNTSDKCKKYDFKSIFLSLNNSYNAYINNRTTLNQGNLVESITKAKSFLHSPTELSTEQNQEYLYNLVSQASNAINLYKKHENLVWVAVTLTSGKTGIKSFDGKNILVTTDVKKLSNGGIRPLPDAKFHTFVQGTSIKSIKNSVILDEPRIQIQRNKPLNPQSDRDYVAPEKNSNDAFYGYVGIDVLDPSKKIYKRYQVLMGYSKNGEGFYFTDNNKKKTLIIDPNTRNAAATDTEAKKIIRNMLRESKIISSISYIPWEELSKTKTAKNTLDARTSLDKFQNVLNDVVRNASINLVIKGEIGPQQRYSVGFSLNIEELHDLYTGKVKFEDFIKKIGGLGIVGSYDSVIEIKRRGNIDIETKKTGSAKIDATNFFRSDYVGKNSLKYGDLSLEFGGGGRFNPFKSDIGAAIGPKLSYKIPGTQTLISKFLSDMKIWAIRTLPVSTLEGPIAVAGNLSLITIINLFQSTKPTLAVEVGLPALSFKVNYKTGDINAYAVGFKPFKTSIKEIKNATGKFFSGYLPLPKV